MIVKDNIKSKKMCTGFLFLILDLEKKFYALFD